MKTIDLQAVKNVKGKSSKTRTDRSNAVIEERQRISRELHDRVLQLLSSARLRAETSRHKPPESRDALAHTLQSIEDSIDHAITEIRNLLAENQDAEEMQAGSLERRLRQELDIFRARTGFKLDFQCAIGAKHLPIAIERELYFTLREGILNAVRHSRASELRLALQRTPNGVKASLKDNGVGFDAVATSASSHYGLKGMKERIRKIGGEFSLDTAPGKGTTITITVPFDGH